MPGRYVLETERGRWPVLVVESLAEQVGGIAGGVVIIATAREGWRNAAIAARITGSLFVLGWRRLFRGEGLLDCVEGEDPCVLGRVAPCRSAGPHPDQHSKLFSCEPHVFSGSEKLS